MMEGKRQRQIISKSDSTFCGKKKEKHGRDRSWETEAGPARKGERRGAGETLYSAPRKGNVRCKQKSAGLTSTKKENGRGLLFAQGAKRKKGALMKGKNRSLHKEEGELSVEQNLGNCPRNLQRAGIQGEKEKKRKGGRIPLLADRRGFLTLGKGALPVNKREGRLDSHEKKLIVGEIVGYKKGKRKEGLERNSTSNECIFST